MNKALNRRNVLLAFGAIVLLLVAWFESARYAADGSLDLT